MYMPRKIDKFLTDWKSEQDWKPLIVKGSRQVGKTESIRHFATDNYDSFIEINFVEEPKYTMITSDGYKTDDIIKNISLIDPSRSSLTAKHLYSLTKYRAFRTSQQASNSSSRTAVSM